MRRNPAAFPTPQTTGCALAHRFCGANTTTTLQTSPARRPPPWGRVGVGAAKKRAATKLHRTSSFTYTTSAQLYVKNTIGCALAHRLPSDTTTAAQSIAVLLPPPWGRAGVGAAKKRAATKPHRTSSFTYTFPATLYVKTTIGYALAHRLPSDTTIAASPRPRRSIGVVAEAANAKKQTSAHKQHLHPPPHLSRPSDCRGGGFSPITTARPSPPWLSSHAKCDRILCGTRRRVGVRLHTANAKSPAVLHPPPWERVGVGAAKKHAATQPHRTSSFTYTPSAQVTVNCPASP